MRVMFVLTRRLREDSQIWDIVRATASQHKVCVVLSGPAALNVLSRRARDALESVGVDLNILEDQFFSMGDSGKVITASDFAKLAHTYDRVVGV